ncbi:MAG: hypothetical protein IJF79_08745, partial [Clostridia bacterium]|nr:hypothetical protein [Clostridia bacterium]
MNDLFLHGHVPGKNTITREQLHKAAAKPARRPEPFCPEKPSEAVLRGNEKSDPFYRTLRIESHRHPVSAKADSKPVGCGTQPTPLNAARF